MKLLHRSSSFSPARSPVVALAAVVFMTLLFGAAFPAQENPAKAGAVQTPQPTATTPVKVLTPEMCLNRWSIGVCFVLGASLYRLPWRKSGRR